MTPSSTILETAESVAVDRPTIRLECRPSRLIAARYEHLPFPSLGPTQEIALDVGVTAMDAPATLSGLVFRGYNDCQLVFEQRWPARAICQRLGQDDLRIPAQTGLAVRSVHFLLHGDEPLTSLEIIALAQVEGDAEAVQVAIQVPVVYPESKTDLHFPLRGAWWAIQAADWSDRHKQEVFSQTYAIDFVKLGADNGFFGGDGLALEDHYSWGQAVYATAGGKVAYVCYDMPDVAPGVVTDNRVYRGDLRRILGNAVTISHGNGEFSYFGHLQQASIQVNEGQIIRRGALIGHVGNSGHSPGPHLHFHLMEGPNPFIDQGLPVKFSHFRAGGQYFSEPITIPTRMIVSGPDAEGGNP